MKKVLKLAAGFFFLMFFSCAKKVIKPLFELMGNTGIDFNNKVVDGEIENSFLFRNFYNGGGVAIGDINNDGLPDIMLTSNMGENKLYLNKGNFKFEDISKKAGLKQDSMWSTGVTFVDINGDGWDDLVVGSGKGGSLAVFLNDGKGGFLPGKTSFAGGVTTQDQTAILAYPEP